MKLYQGDRVTYSVHFLNSIGCSITDPMRHAEGVVANFIAIGQLRIAKVKWDDKYADLELPEKVNVQNLAPVGPNTNYVDCSWQEEVEVRDDKGNLKYKYKVQHGGPANVKAQLGKRPPKPPVELADDGFPLSAKQEAWNLWMKDRINGIANVMEEIAKPTPEQLAEQQRIKAHKDKYGDLFD